MFRLRAAVIAAAALVVLGAARADIITLEDGRQITGQIVEETPTRVTIKVPYGTFSLDRSRIASIERQSPLEYHLAQGDFFSDKGEYAVALREYREALRLGPEDKTARQKLAGGLARVGKQYLRLRRYGDAREIFDELDKFDPGNLDARLGFATMDRELAAVRKLAADAEGLLQGRRFGEAAEALQKAIASCPEMRGELTGRLAAAFRGLAEELYAAGRMSEAAGFFARALTLKPDLASEVESRFISSVMPGVVQAINGKDFKLARERLGVLTGFAPTDPRVLYLQGVILANEGQLAAAADCFARGLGRASAGEATAENVRALHGELQKILGGATLALDKPFEERYTEAQPGDWLQLEGRRFTVYHHNEMLAVQVLQSAEFYLDKVAAGLGLPEDTLWPGRCPIYLYRNQEEYRAATGQESWSGGVYSLETRGGRLLGQKISSFQTAPKLLNNVLPHEIAHLAFMSSIGYAKKFPLVLHEGVAVFNEPAFRRGYYQGVLKSSLKTESTYPFGELFGMSKYPAKPDLFYAQGLSLVEYLVSARGAAVFHKFATDVETFGLASALQKHYGFKDLDEFEKFWKVNAASKS